MSAPAIVVVGAGASGLSTALSLAERGAENVTVIDRGHVAAGSSALSAGVFTRQYTEPLDIELRQECYLRFCDLERQNGLKLRRNGFIRLAHDAATMASFVTAAECQRELGVTDSRAVDADELSRLIPDMRCADLEGALYGPSDGYLDGQQLCMVYAERAAALGVRVLAYHELLGRERGQRGAHRLITSRDPLECDVVVNAAGAWAWHVGGILEAPVEVAAERHQACVMGLARELPYLLPTVMDYSPGSGRLGLYLRPEGEAQHQVIVGLHTNERLAEPESDPDAFHTGVDAAFVDEIVPLLLERMPGFADAGLQSGWAGLYPNAADDQFIIGPCPGADGVFAACGVNGIGVYMSPVVGRLAAEWILDGSPRGPAGVERFDARRSQATAPPPHAPDNGGDWRSGRER
jgi:sarcosine oxidase subunit beta